MMRRCLALLFGALAIASAENLWTRYTNSPPNDPHHTHCQDVTVDADNKFATDWRSANMWRYDGSTNPPAWKSGLCDPKQYPDKESVTSPGGLQGLVTLRKLGKGPPPLPSEQTMGISEAQGPEKIKDCRNSTASPISMSITNDGQRPAKIRGCLNQYACKPFHDCELALAPGGGAETIVFDAAFKYFVFTFHGWKGTPTDVELYPDANMHWPVSCSIKETGKDCKDVAMLAATPDNTDDMIEVHSVDPGNHAHCIEMYVTGGNNNTYWKAHGYQYQPPKWLPSICPRDTYNWFNRNTTIAPGVVQERRGVHKE